MAETVIKSHISFLFSLYCPQNGVGVSLGRMNIASTSIVQVGTFQHQMIKMMSKYQDGLSYFNTGVEDDWGPFH